MVERDNFKVLVKALRAVYTRDNIIPDASAFDTWYALLKDLDYEVLSAAIQKHMMTSPFPPTIADIRSAAQQFLPGGQDDGMTEMEAWLLVRKALRNSAYNAEEEYNRLPPAVQRAVGSPSILEEWSQMDMDTVSSVEQSHFMRSYRAAVAAENEMKKLSPSVRQLVQGVADRIGMKE